MPASFTSAPLTRAPLYLQLAQQIEGRIASGEWRFDQKLPSEARMCETFGVSVGTVRKAIQLLVERGLLITHHGSGTFVKHYTDGGYWNQFQHFQTADGHLIRWESRLIVFETVPAHADVARVLRLSEGTPVLHIRRLLHRADASPSEYVCRGSDETWLNPAFFNGLDAASFEHLDCSLYEHYERRTGTVICSVSDRIEAFVSGPEDLALHGIDQGLPVIRLKRQSRTFGNRPVEYRIETACAVGIQIVC